MFDPDLELALDRAGRNADTLDMAATVMRNRAWFAAHPPKTIDAAVWEWCFVRRIALDFVNLVDVDERRFTLRNRDYPQRRESFTISFGDMLECRGRSAEVELFAERMRAAERRLHPLALTA